MVHTRNQIHVTTLKHSRWCYREAPKDRQGDQVHHDQSKTHPGQEIRSPPPDPSEYRQRHDDVDIFIPEHHDLAEQQVRRQPLVQCQLWREIERTLETKQLLSMFD